MVSWWRCCSRFLKPVINLLFDSYFIKSVVVLEICRDAKGVSLIRWICLPRNVKVLPFEIESEVFLESRQCGVNRIECGLLSSLAMSCNALFWSDQDLAR